MGYIILSCLLVVLSLAFFLTVRHYAEKCEKLEEERKNWARKSAGWQMYAQRLLALSGSDPAAAINTINNRLHECAGNKHPAPSTR